MSSREAILCCMKEYAEAIGIYEDTPKQEAMDLAKTAPKLYFTTAPFLENGDVIHDPFYIFDGDMEGLTDFCSRLPKECDCTFEIIADYEMPGVKEILNNAGIFENESKQKELVIKVNDLSVCVYENKEGSRVSFNLPVADWENVNFDNLPIFDI